MMDQLPKKKELNTGLKEAMNLVSNDRKAQYGDHIDSFNLYADIYKLLTGKTILPSEIAMVMKCIKLGRDRFKHQRDNCVDMIAYESIYLDLKESENSSL